MAQRTRDINYFYPTAESTGYSSELTEKRFSILRKLSFKSVLDVGSGKCNLHAWLKFNDLQVKYDAVDIREDALALCDCDTFTKIPSRRKYDLVCLFGTITYNINENKEENQKLLLDLLDQSFKSSKKYIVFSVIKKEVIKGLSTIQLVSFTKEEIEQIASKYGKFIIDDTTDPEEYIVILTLK